MLELAVELDAVSKACRIMGYSRQQLYEIRRDFQTYGARGLLDRLPGAKGPNPNRLSEDLKNLILDYSLKQPTHGPVRVAQNLVLQGHKVSSGGVRGVWSRHDMLTRHQRLLRLEEAHQKTLIELTEDRVRLLERFDTEYRDRHIEAAFTRQLIAMDTFRVGSHNAFARSLKYPNYDDIP